MQKKLTRRALCFLLSFILLFSTFPVFSGAVAGSRAMVETASSQIGIYEGANGYTKYGEYYGYAYMAWCCAFISWCARTTGIPESVIPNNVSCTQMRNYYISKGLYHLAPAYGGTYIPKQGDLVFFSHIEPAYRGVNNIEHIGIVVSATAYDVTCIEGNCPDRVAQRVRPYSDYVVGYATPEYADSSLINKSGTYRTMSILPFRDGPDGKTVTLVPPGAELEVLEIIEDWGKTEYNGQTGWLSLKLCKFIKAHEHTERKIAAVSPGCSRSGLTAGLECSVCKIVLKCQQHIPATGHKLGEQTVTKEATCSETGEKSRICSVCGYKDAEDIPCIPHTEEIIPEVAPSCVDAGFSESVICTVCEKIIKEAEPHSYHGHAMGEWMTFVEPTAAENGVAVRKCAECEFFEEKEIASDTVIDTAEFDVDATFFLIGLSGFMDITDFFKLLFR